MGCCAFFCLKVGTLTRAQYEARVIEPHEQRPHLALSVGPLLELRLVLCEQYLILHAAMGRFAADDGICRLQMSAPAVVPLVALTFRMGVDEAPRFSRSRSVPAHFGLTSARYQSAAT